MINHTDLAGSFPALITFMKPNTTAPGGFAVDFEGSVKHARKCVRAGSAGVLIAGTTGQSATLTHDEQTELAMLVADASRDEAKQLGRDIKVIVSAGSNATHEALQLSRRIIGKVRPDALLHVTGYYNNPPQEGLLRHFTRVGNVAADLDTGMILYNVPSRTGSALSVDTVAKLSKHPAILAIKEASGDPAFVKQIFEATDRDEFAIISGEDGMVADMMEQGGLGVITASGNVWPAQFQRLTELMAAGDFETGRALQQALMPAVDAVFSVKNPIPLHHMLATYLRPPMLMVNDLDSPGRDNATRTINGALMTTEYPGCDEEQSTHLGKKSGDY